MMGEKHSLQKMAIRPKEKSRGLEKNLLLHKTTGDQRGGGGRGVVTVTAKGFFVKSWSKERCGWGGEIVVLCKARKEGKNYVLLYGD